MNIFKLTFSYLQFKKLNSLLVVILLAVGYASITLILIFSNAFEEKLKNDARTTDVVVGAKGSPLQLVLSSVYHADIPTGNIPITDAKKISKNNQVKKALVIGLGDNYRDYRIVGTEDNFIDYYNAELAEGENFKQVSEVVIGAELANKLHLKLGDIFAGAHGLVGSADVHGKFPYKVVGILKRSNSVIDRLIFTDIRSVWKIHSAHDEDEHHDHDEEDENVNGQITALLLKLKSPVAAFNLPKVINMNSNVMAANTSYEAARFFNIIGIGADALKIFSFIIIATSFLIIFISLYSNLKERLGDYAVIRTIGGSKYFITSCILLESLLLTILGSVIGLAIIFITAMNIGLLIPSAASLDLISSIFIKPHLNILIILFVSALVAALLPAIQIYKMEISKNLK